MWRDGHHPNVLDADLFTEQRYLLLKLIDAGFQAKAWNDAVGRPTAAVAQLSYIFADARTLDNKPASSRTASSTG